MTAPAERIHLSCGWCHPELRLPGDSTGICPECLERHFPDVKLLPARAGRRLVPLPGAFPSRIEAAKVITLAGCINAVLLLIAYLGVEALMSWILP